MSDEYRARAVRPIEDLSERERELMTAMEVLRKLTLRHHPGSRLWERMMALQRAIDDAAGEITGDPQFFFSKPITQMTSGTRAADR